MYNKICVYSKLVVITKSPVKNVRIPFKKKSKQVDEGVDFHYIGAPRNLTINFKYLGDCHLWPRKPSASIIWIFKIIIVI